MPSLVQECEYEALVSDCIAMPNLVWHMLDPKKYKKKKEKFKDHDGREEKFLDRLQTCNVCGEVFENKTYLIRHMKSHNPNAKHYPCDICKKAFKTASRLRLHRDIVHTVSPPLRCPTCGKIFMRVGSLEKHRGCASD